MLLSYYYCNKLPQTQWLKATQIHYFTVLEVQNELKGAPCVGSYSVVNQAYPQLPMLACGKREAMVMAPPRTHHSAVSPCFFGCLTFLHRHFPSQSPSLDTLNPSLQSQQQPSPWGCSTIPKLRLAAAAPSRGPASLSGVCLAAVRTV